jgi:hypothetical protein
MSVDIGVYEMLYQNVDELYEQDLYDVYNSDWSNDNFDEKLKVIEERSSTMAKNYAFTLKQLILRDAVSFNTAMELMVKTRFLEIEVEALRSVRNSIDINACDVSYHNVNMAIRSLVEKIEAQQLELKSYLREIEYGDIEAV